MTAPNEPHPSRVAIPLLFLVSLAGRFTLDRIGTPPLGILDARIWGCAALIAVTFHWRIAQHRSGYQQRWPHSAAWMLALIGVLAVSAFYAPPGARIADRLGDLAALAVLLVVTVVITGSNPASAARMLLWLTLAAGLVYAAAAFRAGGQTQGRYSAFGGGPNVFARVVCMGILAAGALAIAKKRKWPLLAAPPLALAALLSGSRGGLLSLVVAAVVFYLLFFRHLRTSLLAAGVLVGAGAGAVVWKLYAAQAGALTSQRYSLDTLQGSNYSSRLPLLNDAWTIFAGHPWVGGGMDAFWVNYGQYISLGYVHNFPGAVAAETGLVGIIVMILTVRQWMRDGKPWRTMAPERIGCAVLAVYVATESLFSGDYYDSRFAWVFAIAAVNYASRRSHPAEHGVLGYSEAKMASAPAGK